MKKTLKTILVGLALTAVANGQRSLTYKMIDTMYHDAITDQANTVFSDVAKLQFAYAEALRAYRGKLLTGRNPDSVGTIAALDEELANMMAVEGGVMLPLAKGADLKMKSLRDTYNARLEVITIKSEQRVKILRITLVEQLTALKKSLVKSGNMEGALVAHNRLVKLGVGEDVESTEDNDPLRRKSVVLTKEFGGYMTGMSKQKLRLKLGETYTLTFLAHLGEHELNEHDCLPRFSRGEGQPDFKGGDKYKPRLAQRASEKRKVSKSNDSWDKVTVTFTHTYDEPVVFGVVFYQSGVDFEISMRDFSLTDSEGKEFITKNLNGASGWVENEFTSFTK